VRVLIVGINYRPEVTGIGPYNTELAEHLATLGHRVTVLTAFPWYPHWKIDSAYRGRLPYRIEWINSVKVIRNPLLLPGARQTAFRRILFDSSFAASALLGSVRVRRVDVMICVSPPLQLGLTAWLVASTRRARLIVHLQDIVPDAALSTGMMRTGRAVALSRRLERFVYRRADRITVISEGFRANLLAKRVPASKVVVLPNWIDAGRFDVQPDSEVRGTLGAPDGETLVLHTGNMGAKQGLETVVDAAAQLADENIAITLIGDGQSRAALEARASRVPGHRLRFLPLQDDLPATLAAANILVLSQRAQVTDSAAPSKLLSYMAAGKPVVATVNESSEAGHLIKQAGCGIVVPPERPDRLAEAIRELHRHPEKHAELGAAGRRHVAEHFDRATILGRWSDIVHGAAAAAP
jgi:glycosyltransferase involved in cell wall biosynthesis